GSSTWRRSERNRCWPEGTPPHHSPRYREWHAQRRDRTGHVPECGDRPALRERDLPDYRCPDQDRGRQLRPENGAGLPGGTVSGSAQTAQLQPPTPPSPEQRGVLGECSPGPCPRCGACDARGYDSEGRPLIHVPGAEE